MRQRFWAKVAAGTRDQGQCWTWTAARAAGHPVFSPKHGQTRSARRVAYQLEIGPIADTDRLVSVCGTGNCVNPYPGHVRIVAGMAGQLAEMRRRKREIARVRRALY
jgi:hypothetical protein